MIRNRTVSPNIRNFPKHSNGCLVATTKKAESNPTTHPTSPQQFPHLICSMTSCLCLGPTGSGKTLLLKRLVSLSINEGTSTVETVGSNIIQVPRKSPTDKSKGPSSSNRPGGAEDKDFLAIREIGGSMAPLWPSYYSPDKLILFVLDSSNLFQVSISTVLLMELLSHEKLMGAKVLIILSKMDLTDRKKLNYLKFMMRLDAIVTQAGARVALQQVSATNGEGIEDVRKWLVTNWPRIKKPATTMKQAAAIK